MVCKPIRSLVVSSRWGTSKKTPRDAKPKQMKPIIAPEICVEVVSASNTGEEMEEKKSLYFARGAQEVWVCENGVMRFYRPDGPLEKSVLVPDFPKRIEIDD